MHVLHTTPADPVVMAIGVVTELSPDEQMTGIFTAREIEYAAASVGVAYSFPICQANSLINAKNYYEVKHRPILQFERQRRSIVVMPSCHYRAYSVFTLKHSSIHSCISVSAY